MKDLDNLIKQHEVALNNANLLKQKCIQAKDAIPYSTKEYNEARGIELRNKYIELDDEWRSAVREVLDLEEKLIELGYTFPNK